jgi:phosphoglycolate phosphatase
MSRPRRFDLIAFDWDGTLFDSTALIARCIQAACRDLGVPVPSDEDAATSSAWACTTPCSTPRPDLPRERYPELGGVIATITSRSSTRSFCSRALCRCCRR